MKKFFEEEMDTYIRKSKLRVKNFLEPARIGVDGFISNFDTERSADLIEWAKASATLSGFKIEWSNGCAPAHPLFPWYQPPMDGKMISSWAVDYHNPDQKKKYQDYSYLMQLFIKTSLIGKY